MLDNPTLLYHQTERSAMPTRTLLTEAIVDTRDIEKVIIELLALERGCTPAELERELLAGGADMPVDSLLAVEVLVRVEEIVGARLEASPANGVALRSVRAFARAMADAAAKVTRSASAAGGAPA